MVSGSPKPGAECVFILGIMHRSGTNLLLELLAKHPQITAHDVPEDFLIAEIDQLESYIDSVARRWNDKWYDEHSLSALRVAIGRGLAEYLAENSRSESVSPQHVRCATKSPSVDGLPLFREFFPEASLLILVRDGRSVVESGIRSFGWRPGRASMRWAKGARTILEFLEADPNPTRTQLVRFEDLVERRAETMLEIYSFLGIDPDRIKLDDLVNAPILGSSDLASSDGGRVHWQPVPDTGYFRPMDRSASWSQYQHAVFNQTAGTEMKALGYETKSTHTFVTSLATIARFADWFISGLQRIAAALSRQRSAIN